MDCEKVRDRFSSLWEKELTPLEEKMVREHLSSCPACQKELERFEKTMQWLHSVGEEEVPDGFSPELYKKMEERKGRGLDIRKIESRWFHLPTSFKLPAQAVAMVAIVFLVLYLTKMMPMEVYRLKESPQTSSPLSVEKKPGQLLGQKELERERGALETTPEASRHKDVEQAKAPIPDEGKIREGSIPQVPVEKKAEQELAQKGVESERRALETSPEIHRQKGVEQPKAPAPGKGKWEEAPIPQIKAEAKKAEAPSSKTEAMGYQVADSQEAGGAKVPSPEPGKFEKGLVAKEKSMIASKPPQEMILRVSDRGKVISKLYEMVKQFRGEIIPSEENVFLVSLPTGSFSEFERELAGLSSSTETDKMIAKKRAAGSLSASQREEFDKKNGEPARSAADEESRIVVRILLVQE